jgi:hypothetical protein
MALRDPVSMRGYVMKGWQRIGVVISVAWLVGLPTVQALAQDQNAQTLIQAARSLKFTEPGNKAFKLEKQETVVSEVAGDLWLR